MAASEWSKPDKIFGDFLELDLLCEEEADLYKHVKCPKNPGHQNFISVDQFSLEHLPAGYRDQDLLDCVRALADITCRVTVKQADSKTASGTNKGAGGSSTKKKLPPQVGTGCIYNIEVYDEQECESGCLCTECSESIPRKKSFAEIEIETAAHVLNEGNVQIQAVCDFFYNRGDTVSGCSEAVTLTSTPVLGNPDAEDRLHFILFTHNLELAHKLERCFKRFTELEDKIHKKFQTKEAENKADAEFNDKNEPLKKMFEKFKLSEKETDNEKNVAFLDAETYFKHKMEKESTYKDDVGKIEFSKCRDDAMSQMMDRWLDLCEGRAINPNAEEYPMCFFVSMKKIYDIVVNDAAPETGMFNARFYKYMTEIETQLPVSPLWNCRISEDAVKHLKVTSEFLIKGVKAEQQKWEEKIRKHNVTITRLFGEALKDKFPFWEELVSPGKQKLYELRRMLNNVIRPVSEIVEKNWDYPDIQNVIHVYKDQLRSNSCIADSVTVASTLPCEYIVKRMTDTSEEAKTRINEMINFIDIFFYSINQSLNIDNNIEKGVSDITDGNSEKVQRIDKINSELVQLKDYLLHLAMITQVRYLDTIRFIGKAKRLNQRCVQHCQSQIPCARLQDRDVRKFTSAENKKSMIDWIYSKLQGKLACQLLVDSLTSKCSIEEDMHRMEMTLFENLINVTEILMNFISQYPMGKDVPCEPTQSSGTVSTDTDQPVVIIVSHPHGCAKTVSVGRCVSSDGGSDIPFAVYTTPTCKGSSGASVLRVDKPLPFHVHVGSLQNYNYSCCFIP